MTDPANIFTPTLSPAEFLHAVWGEGPHSLCWAPPQDGDPRDFPFGHFDEPEALLLRAAALRDRDLWFGAHPLKAVPPRRGAGSDVAAVWALHADLDWYDPVAHKDADLPVEAELRRALGELPSVLAPWVVVHSGHGLQPWWLLTHPVPPAEGLDLLDRLTAVLEELGLENGRRDLASVLRLPGSVNHKTTPVPVFIEHYELDGKLDPDDLRRLARPTSRTGAGTSRPAGGAVTEAQEKLLAHLIDDYQAEFVRVRGGVIFVRYPDASYEHSATVWTGGRGDALCTVFSTNWVKDFPEAGRRGKTFVLGWDDRLYLADDFAAWVKFDQQGHDSGGEPTTTDEPPVGFRFRRYSVRELLAEDRTTLWAVQGMLCQNTYGLDAGAEKALKSYFGLARAVALASGEPMLGKWRVPERMRVLAFVAEGGRRPFTTRLERMCEAHGIKAADLDGWLEVIDRTAALGSANFVDGLTAELVKFTPGLVWMDPYYPFVPPSVSTSQLTEVGSMLTQAHMLCADHGATLWFTMHLNQSGAGFDLKRVSGAGAGEWADSWTLLRHRSPGDLAGGKFRLELVIGSRQWGGSTWDLDLNIGRFDETLGRHDGPITFDVRAASPTPSADDQTVHDKKIADATVAMNRVASKRTKPFTKTQVVDSTGGTATVKRAAFDRLVDSGALVCVGETAIRFGKGSRPVDTYLHHSQAPSQLPGTP